MVRLLSVKLAAILVTLSHMQVASESETAIAGLADCSIVAHTALACISGRQYAVVISRS